MVKVTLDEDLNNYLDVIKHYEDILQQVPHCLLIEGKTLEEANVSQALDYSYYAGLLAELKAFSKTAQAYTEQKRSKLWKNYTEVHSIALSTRDKDQYINSESSYLTAKKKQVALEEIQDKYEAVVDAFRQRGFALRNITNARVSSVQDAVL